MLVMAGLLLTACSNEDESTNSTAKQKSTETVESRWYGAENVARGGPIFAAHCAECHGNAAQGSSTWRQPGADGKFPPPPLNGTGHAWHHPFRALGSQIKFGTPGGGGSMVGFEQTLSDQDIVDVIAWFQDKWPDEIYASWFARDKQSRSDKQ